MDWTSLIHSVIHSLIHSLTHSLTHFILICWIINLFIEQGLNVLSPTSPARFCSVLIVVLLADLLIYLEGGGTKLRLTFLLLRLISLRKSYHVISNFCYLLLDKVKAYYYDTNMLCNFMGLYIYSGIIRYDSVD